MALTLGWTMRDVYAHTPRQLEAMVKALEVRNRKRRMAAAHRRAR